MDNRKTNNGQLRPLEKRMGTGRFVRREEKKTRREFARMIGQDRQIIGGILSVLRRGFFGRLKWLLFGK